MMEERKGLKLYAPWGHTNLKEWHLMRFLWKLCENLTILQPKRIRAWLYFQVDLSTKMATQASDWLQHFWPNCKAKLVYEMAMSVWRLAASTISAGVLKKLHWVKAMTHPWIMDNNCVKYYPHSIWQQGVVFQTQNLAMCALTTVNLTLEIGPCVKAMEHPCVMDNNCVKYYLPVLI